MKKESLTLFFLMRLFVAVRLPEDDPNETAETLASLGYGLPGANWVGVDAFHLTLAFVEEADQPTTRELESSLGAIVAQPFELTIRGLGLFPLRGEPRQLWAGVDDSASLELLRGRVQAALSRAGLPRETRKFQPHITLAHLHSVSPERLAAFIIERSFLKLPPVLIEEFSLLSSERISGTRVHEVIESYPLVGLPVE